MKTLGNFGRQMVRQGVQLPLAVAASMAVVRRKIERHQVQLLSGAGDSEAGAYPVPIRTGTLRRSAGSDSLGLNRAVVFNTAEYAGRVHAERPFLQDAVDRVDVMGTFAGVVHGVMRQR